MTIPVISAACGGAANPLLGEFDTPHGTPPFSKIKTEHYLPAFEQAVSQSRAQVAAIADNPQPATFANTIEALERQGALLDRVATIFFALNECMASDRTDAIANEVQPKLTELSNDIMLNERLFERVRAVWNETRQSTDYTPEERMLLEKTYKGFTRSGAALEGPARERYRVVTSELAMLGLAFGQNVRNATNAFTMNIVPGDEARIAELPGFVREGMAAEAAQRGETGWTVTLQHPSYLPFMTYSSDRELKEKLFMARSTLCTSGQWDNSANVAHSARLRLELARLLGYRTYADYVLEERMADSRETVYGFLDRITAATHGWAIDECRAVEDFARTMPDAPASLARWDFSYYSERFRRQSYQVSEEEIKPYFQLDSAQAGVFTLANRLYGITLQPATDIEVYHPDVRAYRVTDSDGSLLAVLYMDYFPRESKRGGAWMTSFREMGTEADGTEVRPLVTCCFNFTKPTPRTPSLLTFEEVETLLHEFGHALHGIFAKGKYGSLTGTSVYRDFVELPSQVMENWATEQGFLDMWAVHYLTGEKMPAELIGKIEASKNFLAAYNHAGQLGYAYIDMAWHSITEPVTESPESFEERATRTTRILPLPAGVAMSPSFGHIFGGGYAAGYYSYMWAEVLDADAYSLFKEKGIFSREVAQSFRDNVLSRGGSEPPMTLYVRFRGHEPDTGALIDRIGEEHNKQR